MMEYFQEGRSGRNLAGLRCCVEHDSGLPSGDIQDWLEVKSSLPSSFSDDANLDMRPCQRRPLSADLLLYAAGDVEYLPSLYETYSLRLKAQGWRALHAETEKRLRQSRMPAYDPQRKQKGKGPYRLLDLAGNITTRAKASVRHGGQGHKKEAFAKSPKPHTQWAGEEARRQ